MLLIRLRKWEPDRRSWQKKQKESGLTVWQNDNRRTGTLRKGENV